MKKLFGWAVVLLLAGCQMPQQDKPTVQEAETNSVPEQTMTPLSSGALPEAGQINTQTVFIPAEPEEEPEVIIGPAEQDDVWKRIGMQLSIPVPDQKKVNYYRNWYLKHPNHLESVSRRAKPFLYLIVQKIEERNLPLELALLPVVESSFDPFAYSHGSAAGLWQFVPGTGKMYGLKQNFWYDGRRDVAAATDAALDYLTYLSNRFHGNWNHAIAAYNSGGGRVSRAIRKNTRQNKPTDFFSLDLPKETSSYVPKLLALADIVAHQDKYGLSIPAIPNRPVLKQTDPGEQLDLAIAAKYAGISVKQLQSYNPAFNRWATAPEGPYSLLLPVDRVAQFELAASANRGKGLTLIRYRVKSGDAISLLAKKYKTTSAVIREANGLSSNMIRAGQYLMIPTSTKDGSTYALSAKNRLAKTQSVSRGQYKLTYTVASGDSLWTIARKHKVSHRSLAKWNGMGPRDTLRIGQKLVIWKKGSKGSIIRTVHYRVRRGDTISAIASRFKVRSADIIKWNNLGKQKYIQPGQQLKLYVDVTKVSV